METNEDRGQLNASPSWKGVGDSDQSLALVPIPQLALVVSRTVKRLSESRRGAEFEALWSGDLTGYRTNWDAQLDLCSLLVSALGPDAGQIDEVFRESALMDPSWDLKSKAVGGETLGAGVIHQAINERLAALTTLMSDAIALDDHFAVNAGTVFFRYDDGVYREDGQRFIERRVKEISAEWRIDAVWSTRLTNEIVSYIRVDAPSLWERPPEDRLNVRNGILDLATERLSPHSPDFLSPVQLPEEYDPDAKCPAWEKQVAETFPEDAQAAAWEIVALLMNPIDAIQKAVLLVGEGANGKSVYLDALQVFLGPGNVTNIPLQKLSSDRFAVARIDGKLANICADLPSGHVEDTSVFKQIVGHDRMDGEHKFLPGFEFTPFCGLVFSANQPPRSPDSSQGYFRRWLVVPFEHLFEGSIVVPKGKLVQELTTPTELSGLLNKALDARKQMLKRNDFMSSPSLDAALADFRAATDPFAVWLERNTEVGDSVLKRDLRDAYVEYCEAKRIPAPSLKAFGQMVKRLRPDIAEGTRTVNGKRPEVWVGIQLIE